MQWLMLVYFISKEMFRMAWTELWLWVKPVPGVFILRGVCPKYCHPAWKHFDFGNQLDS